MMSALLLMNPNGNAATTEAMLPPRGARCRS